MKTRIPYGERPWLTGTAHDRVSPANMMHYDIRAFAHGADIYLTIMAREGGRKAIAYSVFKYDPLFGTLSASQHDVPPDAKRVQWAKDTAHVFERVHGALLALCDVPHGYSQRSIHCHYVKALDADPWPRDLFNGYVKPVYAEGKRAGRPRKLKPLL